ncbi:MAG: acetoacetate--CoA ligase [Proteobacteria bacterium]|nr:acetoacetate--CoA ligase [Pseudomonadota bacterium]
MADNPILWSPGRERVKQSAMYKFMSAQGFDNYADLHRWSHNNSQEFWQALCDFSDVKFSKPGSRVLDQPGDMTTARWFDDATLSFPEHILRHGGKRAAIVFRGENGERRELSFDELRLQVAGIAAGLKSVGVTKGDRVTGFLPNCPEAIIAMLGATSIGAIWSSCSPDFGINGVVDRFGQIEPKVLFCADGYFYNGKRFDSLPAVGGVLDIIPGIGHTVVVGFTGNPVDLDDVRGGVHWRGFMKKDADLDCAPVEFNHPLYIMYSSGTTGVPKCIVHGTGGTLIQHMKEHGLHCNIGSDDRVFYFTTCGWMMWNWLVSALMVGATIVLYDGSPFYQEGRALWRMAEEEKLTVFGTSAKFIAALEKVGVRPGEEFDLSSIKTILSTGSVLAPESFDFVYDAISADVQLSSISGGTDILSCFAGGNPMLPVRRGELQCLALGMAVEVYNDEGEPVTEERGELVCSNAFPSMPVRFWNDPDNSKYHAAYFERFPGVWAHGDYAEITANAGMVIYGRSDAVLNPGGVRIGTAEIYRQVEKLDEVIECLAIGQDWDDDVRIVLFVVMRPGVALDDAVKSRVRQVIRENTTPRHVPAKIIAVPEIPRTISGKIVELAVRNVVHGKPVKNTDALANPMALEYFRDLDELSSA